MPRKLTPRSSLTHLTREAKRWLKALRAGDPGARARLAQALADPPATPTLRDIQHALAREFGLPGWTALREAVAASGAPGEGDEALLARFLENACPDHHVRGASDFLRARQTALRLLTRFPDLADASFQAEIVCGDLDGVREALAGRPELASAAGDASEPARAGLGHRGDLDHDLGPKGWEPLLYLCYARLPLPRVAQNAIAIATALLDAGADPNAWFKAGDCRFSALVGVIGEGEGLAPPHPRRDELVRLLLERGAEPYDLQVQYNIHFNGQVLWWLELVHEYSLRLGRHADWEDPAWAHMDMGGYGNGARWYLDIAIKHRDPALAEWCLAHGADPNAAPARSHMFPQHPLHETAVRAGATDIAELLARYGAKVRPVRLTPADQLRLAALRLDRETVRQLVAEHPGLREDPGPPFAVAQADRADAMALLLDAGVSMEVENASRQRPLHAAAYSNALDVARLLLARGAEIDPVETTYGGTPLGHATYARNQEMMDLLAEHSRDVWELASIGKAERLAQVLASAPEPVRLRSGDQTPLLWLPTDDEARAIEVARVLLRHGADPTVKTKEGRTAAGRAERLGMYDLARLLREAARGTERPVQADYDDKVTALMEAFHTGTPQAMERLWRHTWHRRGWQGMRTYAQLDLGRRQGDPDFDADLSADDARFLVAREHGFESWEALVAFVARPAKQGTELHRPMGLERRDAAGGMERVGSEREWGALLERVRMERIEGLRAEGQMTDQLLAGLAGLESLVSLDLSGCRGLTDEGLRDLARLPGLRRINLSNTLISDHGLEVLAELPGLERVELAWTGVTDAGLQHLAGCERLAHLELAGTPTGDGTLRMLAVKEHLRFLHTGQRVTDAGLPLLHQVPAFRTWRDEPVEMALLEWQVKPNQLVLRGAITDRGLGALAGLEGLFALNICEPSLGLTAAGLASLRELPHLGMLGFAADDAAMAAIAALPRLRFLMCQDNTAGDDGWTALSRSRTLEQIWGRECPNLGGRGFRALATMPALTGLAVSCLHVDDASLAALPAFPALRELMPMDVPDEGYRHVARCERLESLVLMYCRETTDRATEHLAALPRLRTYFGSYNRTTDRTPALLAGMASLEEVEFSSIAGLTDAGIAALARLPNLTRLSVSGNRQVTGSFASAFGPGVRVQFSRW